MIHLKIFSQAMFLFFSFISLSGCICSSEKSKTMTQSNCSEEKSLKSSESIIKKLITFRNETNAPVKTYWLDFEGNRKLYATVQAGEEYDQITYATHPWVIANESDQCLYLLPNADSENQTFEIGKQ
jgi:hypothetical protein